MVYFPEDSQPADQSCKLSHTLGVKNSYTPCGQLYTMLSQPYTPCGHPYTPIHSLLWYKPVIPLPLRGLADTLFGLRPHDCGITYICSLAALQIKGTPPPPPPPPPVFPANTLQKQCITSPLIHLATIQFHSL